MEIINKVLKGLTKLSVTITIVSIIIGVPLCVLACLWYAYNMEYLNTLFYILVAFLLLLVNERVVK